MNKTYFAPAERKDEEEINGEFERVAQSQYVFSLVDSLPYVCLLLNQERQTVFGNTKLLELLGLERIKDVIGARPGELVHCVHSSKQEGGCGTSKDCRYCGAVNVILETQKAQEKTTGECRIVSQINDETINFDLRVTCYPLPVAEEAYYMLIFEDISGEKRREQLEKIFLHDLMNTAGGLVGISNVLAQEMSLEEQQETTSLLVRQSERVMNEIKAHKDLLAAENKTLELCVEPSSAKALIKLAVESAAFYNTKWEKKITTHTACDDVWLKTDPRLLVRVLTNLLKNALEAAKTAEDISIGCTSEDGCVRFFVKNAEVMPDDVKSQIFQRSFSTKGTGRGLGAYSVKLLTENYLGGKVFFSSEPGKGTEFILEFTNNDP